MTSAEEIRGFALVPLKHDFTSRKGHFECNLRASNETFEVLSAFLYTFIENLNKS